MKPKFNFEEEFKKTLQKKSSETLRFDEAQKAVEYLEKAAAILDRINCFDYSEEITNIVTDWD